MKRLIIILLMVNLVLGTEEICFENPSSCPPEMFDDEFLQSILGGDFEEPDIVTGLEFGEQKEDVAYKAGGKATVLIVSLFVLILISITIIYALRNKKEKGPILDVKDYPT